MTYPDTSGTTDFQSEQAGPASQVVPANPTEPKAEPAPVNPLENETMIRELMTKIADAVVGASSLKRTVEELTQAVNALRQQNEGLVEALRQEREYVSSLNYDLANTKAALKTSQDYATECEAEIEKMRNDLAQARREKDQAVNEAANWFEVMGKAEEALRQATQAHAEVVSRLETEVAHLREQNGKQAAKIVKMIGALQE